MFVLLLLLLYIIIITIIIINKCQMKKLTNIEAYLRITKLIIPSSIISIEKLIYKESVQ